MKYIEHGDEWDALPDWVNTMIQLGYRWPKRNANTKRKIGIITMPCASPAASLIGLGALVSDLENEKSNDLDLYFDYLKLLCKNEACVMDESHEPIIIISSQGVKYKFNHASNAAQPDRIELIEYAYKTEIRRKGKTVKNEKRPCVSYILKNYVKGWRIDGEPVPEVNDGKSLDPTIYKELFPNSIFIPENLKRSYSGLVMCVPAYGRDSEYMESIYDVGFKMDRKKSDLGTLLTIHNGEDGLVSRVACINRNAIQNHSKVSYLVIADGALSFLNCVDHFKESDIICVISKMDKMENIQAVSDKLNHMKRYYSEIPCDSLYEINFRSISALFMEQK